ncbi:rRNA maturation RNase YbeY [Risungbinella massiliensis]|uniref:rRNA maturation RNase YbeY n=1 Tax=Risungbinella massiliensis TaxID=1329796 RepID=UPI0005CC8766|nr:rRNA maturation RNase YbeY [Risungbinella massiliensis]
MSLNLQVIQEIECTKEEEQALVSAKRALEQAVIVEECPPVEVVLTIVDNDKIQEINREHRNLDRPTDVLSFPLYEADEDFVLEEEEEFVSLGDIVLSMPQAKKQALDYGHSLEREVAFLAVHGFLHLLGYDHETQEEEKEMFARQEAILQQIGLTR